MDWQHVKTHWTSFIPQVLTRWPDLDEDEVQASAGNRAAFTAHLAEIRGLDAEDAAVEVDDWLMGAEPIDAVMDPTRDNEGILKSAAHIPEGEDVYDDDRLFGDDDQADPPMGRSD
jgi:hypothetical protein